MDQNALLANQLRLLQLSEDTPPDAQAWKRLLHAVNETYQRLEHDRRMLIRSPAVAFSSRNTPDWPIDYVSQNVTRFGYTTEYFLTGRIRYADLIHEDDREWLREAVTRHIAHGPDQFNVEYRIRHGDGRWIWVNDHTWLIRDSDGEVTAIHGILFDITEHKHAQQALAESEKRLRALFDNLPNIAVQGCDTERRVIFWNQASERLYGYSSAEAMGQKIEDLLIPHSQKNEIVDALDRWFKGGPALPAGELTLRCKDGRLIRVSSAHVLQPGPRGPELYSIDIDLSERERAQQALLASEIRHQRLYETMSQGVAYYDAKGRRLSANPAAKSLLGDGMDALSGLAAANGHWTVLDENGSRVPSTERPGAVALETGSTIGPVTVGLCDTTAGAALWLSVTAVPLFEPGVEHPSQVHVTFEDVSERHNAHRRELAIVSALAVGVAAVDKESGKFIYVNDHFCTMIGRSRDALLNTSPMEIHPKERVDEIHARFWQMVRGEIDLATDIPVRRADGKDIWLDIRASHVTIGEHEAMVAVFSDMSQRHNAEKNYQMLFREMLEGFALHEVICDESGKPIDYRYLAVNPSFERITGLKARDLIGHTAKEVFPETDAEWIETFGRVALEGTPLRLEHFSAHLARHLAIAAFQPAPRQFAGVVSDITERKVVEAELRKLALAVEQSPANIVITNAHAEIEYVNAAFTARTGYAAEEVLGKNPRILQSGRTAAETYDAMWAALTEGNVWSGEFINRRKDGTEYVELAVVSPLRQEDGTVTHYVAVKEDITDAKRAADELETYRSQLEDLVQKRTVELHEAKRHAEAANKAKTRFLANMSHEIRTPLNAILGLSHLMKADADNKQVEQLSKIESAGRHLLSIINDILDISKIEANHLVLESINFHLSEVLDQTRSLISPLARAKGLRVDIDGDAVPVWLRGDPTRLRQALLNYASNAVKFTNKGYIALNAKLLETEGDSILVLFEVRDSGRGIPPDQLPNVFKAFEQADASTTRQFGGTGLGLAITRRLAAMMNGEVGAESTPGIGSRFWFTARLRRGHGVEPVQRTLAEHVDARTLLRERHRVCRVLLADDNVINREVALQFLYDLNLEVDVAEDGAEAIARAKETRYDLVLMDVQMPQLDGLDATRALRALPGWERVPILAMTANAFESDRETCLAAGMNDFIAKPIDPDLMYQALHRWLPADRTYEETSEAVVASVGNRSKMLESPLGSIPGLDVRRGQAIVGDQPHLFLRILDMFVQTHAADVNRLRALSESEDWNSLEDLAHSLKGAAGSIGAVKVSELAADLQTQAGRRTLTAADSAGALARELHQLIDAIRAVLGARTG